MFPLSFVCRRTHASHAIWQQRHLRLAQSLERSWTGNSRALKISAETLEAVKPPTDRRLKLTVAGIHVNNWFARNRLNTGWCHMTPTSSMGDFNGCADSIGGAEPAVAEMLPPERWHLPPTGLRLYGQTREWFLVQALGV